MRRWGRRGAWALWGVAVLAYAVRVVAWPPEFTVLGDVVLLHAPLLGAVLLAASMGPAADRRVLGAALTAGLMAAVGNLAWSGRTGPTALGDAGWLSLALWSGWSVVIGVLVLRAMQVKINPRPGLDALLIVSSAAMLIGLSPLGATVSRTLTSGRSALMTGVAVDLLLFGMALSAAAFAGTGDRLAWGLSLALAMATVGDLLLIRRDAAGEPLMGGPGSLVSMMAISMTQMFLIMMADPRSRAVPASRAKVGLVATGSAGVAALVATAGTLGLAPRVATVPAAVAVTVAALLWALDGRSERAATSEVVSLRRAATTDELTGLGNRRALVELARSATAAGRCISLALMDLDGFKAVNDTSGHARGDAVLVAAARVLQEGCRPWGTAFRLGGDEFVVVADADEGCRLTAIGEHLAGRLDEFHPGLGVSVGTSRMPQDGVCLNVLLAAADARLYQAKGQRGPGSAIA